MSVIPRLKETINKLESEFEKIPGERRAVITELTSFIQSKQNHGQPILLNFICTHNSRRSHIAQIWAQTAAFHYSVKGVESFSGGTESTAFNPRAVAAMRAVGFQTDVAQEGSNPTYRVRYSIEESPLFVFSKKYDAHPNPAKNFAAVMTCAEADTGCPIIKGAEVRISLSYNDPKAFDETVFESEKYLERVQEIGREIFFAFSQVKR